MTVTNSGQGTSTRVFAALVVAGLLSLGNSGLALWASAKLGAVDELGRTEDIDSKVAAIRNGEVPPEKVAVYLNLKVSELEATAETARQMKSMIQSSGNMAGATLIAVLVGLVLLRRERRGDPERQ